MINQMPSEATEGSDSSPGDTVDENQSRRLLVQALLSAQSQIQVAVDGLLDCVQTHMTTAEEDEDMEDMDYSEEEDEEMEEICFRGSLPGRQNVEKDWTVADELLESHYFGPNATYNNNRFKRRVGISKQFFSQIVDDLKDTEVFSQKYNPVNKKWGTFRFKHVAKPKEEKENLTTRILSEEENLEKIHPLEVSTVSKPPNIVNTQTLSSFTASSTISTVGYNE